MLDRIGIMSLDEANGGKRILCFLTVNGTEYKVLTDVTPQECEQYGGSPEFWTFLMVKAWANLQQELRKSNVENVAKQTSSKVDFVGDATSETPSRTPIEPHPVDFTTGGMPTNPNSYHTSTDDTSQ